MKENPKNLNSRAKGQGPSRRSSPVGQRGAAVVGGDPVLGGLALHYDVFPEFLPDQGAGHGTCRPIKRGLRTEPRFDEHRPAVIEGRNRTTSSGRRHTSGSRAATQHHGREVTQQRRACVSRKFQFETVSLVTLELPNYSRKRRP